MRLLHNRLAKKARRAGHSRAGWGWFLPRPSRNRDASAPAFVATRGQGRMGVFLLVLVVALTGYLALFYSMNHCVPFFCD